MACAQEWQSDAEPMLSNHAQLTSASMFVKAGEAYFSPKMDWIVFQAIPVPAEGGEPDEHYSMYAAPLKLGSGGEAASIGEPVLLSAPGSANTCGWFHPTEAGVVLFGSTLAPPSEDNVPGYQRDKSSYSWAFPTEMEIVSASIGSKLPPKPIFEQPGYTAEGSWSSDGRFILYANVDDARSEQLGRGDADLWVYDRETKVRTPLVTAVGYDGGPFFGPGDKWICYRSDRKGDDLLQLFAAELAYDDTGAITGIQREVVLSDNGDVNWAPFWHPSGEALLYTSSAHGHFNYEVLAVEFDPDKAAGELKQARVTEAAGFDGLSVFSPDGKWMMWTSQRGEGGSSQIWIGRFNTPVLRGRLMPEPPKPVMPADDGN